MTPKVRIIAIRMRTSNRKEVFQFLSLRPGGYGRDVEWSLVKNRKSAYRFPDQVTACIASDWFHSHYWNHDEWDMREIQEMKIPNRGGQHDEDDND